MRTRSRRGGTVAAVLLSSLVVAASAAGQPSVEGYGKLPLHFEPNQGQTHPRVRFVSRGRGYALFLTPTEALLALRGSEPYAASDAVRLKLAGGNPKAEVMGQEELPGKSHYFIGNDPEKWRTNVPQYARVEYREVWPGVSLAYYGSQGQLEYDFVVSPGADPKRIRLRVEGAKRVRLDGEGNLVVTTRNGGEVVQKAPLIYQEIDGARKPVSGRYVLRAKHEVGFDVGSWDPTKPLVIDPVLVYSTYLGGSDSESAEDVAIDASGNAYVTGQTLSIDFPTSTPLQVNRRGDLFVTKLNAAGSALVYSTYLGGSSFDSPWGIASDASGNAYVTGSTRSSDFPTVNPLQGALNGTRDAFVAKLNASGSALVYSTYLGGSGSDGGRAIAADGVGNAYLIGSTESTDFPVASPLQSASRGTLDAFVAKLNAAGSALAYSTYLGGNFDDFGRGIAVDGSGNACVAGWTFSTDFPTANPLQAAKRGDVEAFVAKLDAAGSALVYSTYLGGGADDRAEGIAVDGSGNAYVTGTTSSTDFPTASPLQPANRGGFDAFVAKLNAAGSALVYSSYLGGSSDDGGAGVAVDPSGNAYVTGYTTSDDFPTASPVQPAGRGYSAFVAKLNAAGSALAYSTYLGGGVSDRGTGIAVDTAGSAYVAGLTFSSSFPTVNAVQPVRGGGLEDPFVGEDAFLVKLGETGGRSLSISDVTVTEGDGGTTPALFTISLSPPASAEVVTVGYITQSLSAFPGSDFFAVSGTLTFAPGTMSETVTVSVLGDRTIEPAEVFLVALRNARGATVSKVQGQGTILNDDQPGVSIGDRTVAEGAAANAAFLVTLVPAASGTVTVSYSTADGTATAGSDYSATSGTLTFTPFRTTQSIIVPILTDTIAEGSETFFVDLSNPVGAAIASGRGTATIDDPPAPARVPMYRAYSRNSDYHLFTTDRASKDLAVTSLGYQDESTPVPYYVWNSRQTGTMPLFRLFNPNRGRHFYTADVWSRDYLISIGMNYEGEEGFIYPTQVTGTTELFRLYNMSSGTHLYTAVAEQKDFILAAFPGVWVQHTSVGYVFTNP